MDGDSDNISSCSSTTNTTTTNTTTPARVNALTPEKARAALSMLCGIPALEDNTTLPTNLLRVMYIQLMALMEDEQQRDDIREVRESRMIISAAEFYG